jgi:hypothetical protein
VIQLLKNDCYWYTLTQPSTLQVLCTIFGLGVQWILVDLNLEYGLFKVEFEISTQNPLIWWPLLLNS